MAEDAARELPLGVSASGGASRSCGVSGTAPCDGVRTESHDFVAAATEGAQIIEQSLLRASSVTDRDGPAARANLVVRAHSYKTRAARKTCALVAHSGSSHYCVNVKLLGSFARIRKC